MTNTATAQGVPPKTTTPVVSDPSTATVPVIGAPGITVVKSARPLTFSRPGTLISYSFLVTNNGNVTLTSVQVNDTDLPGLSAITCPDPTLAPGASETCHATYVTTAADVRAGRVTNTATAQGDPPGSTTPVISQPSTVTVKYVHRPRPPVPPTPTPSPTRPTPPVPPTPTPTRQRRPESHQADADSNEADAESDQADAEPDTQSLRRSRPPRQGRWCRRRFR